VFNAPRVPRYGDFGSPTLPQRKKSGAEKKIVSKEKNSGAEKKSGAEKSGRARKLQSPKEKLKS